MSDSPFSVQDVPGKGKGVVATRAIAQGELILAEAPLFTQIRSRSNATVLAALSALSDADQRQYFSLANARRGRAPPPIGIFETNALPCGDNDPSRGAAADSAAIFLLGSRFNSSCQPNVSNYWDERMQKITFWATRASAVGEELCIGYSACLVVREERRRWLQAAFGFVCRCAACEREGAELRASDERRVAIARLYQEVDECRDNNPAVGVRKVKTALRLLGEEGLLPNGGLTLYHIAFQLCVSVADVKNAKAWLKKAWEAYYISTGRESEDTMELAAYMEDVRKHPAFDRLSRRTLTGPDA
ncbi:hypothetical protein V8D89_002710 [Ganoderma adspersum]